ncbi:acyl carrier protein [Micromonospora viridifaciens]|uniref:Acyl carrier protein n=1 Tax=Micromonospora viridifaciens TaxID=1881 RepID=A0A1C4WUC6_MICVI|nr:acyl carrier protein [Micromonospora viridifaciens]SCE99847.1 acyl carrier protein [Micromonospora viridifaciens]
MDEQQAVELVTRLVARGRGVDTRALTPGTDLVDDLGFDSLDASELLAALHTETGTHLPLSDLSDLRTIGDIGRALTTQEATP